MELKQLATGRMTRKGYVLFGRIRLCLDKPGQEGSNAMFSLVEYAYVWTGSPQVTYLQTWRWAGQEGTDSYVLFGEYTYVWIGSPQVTI